jgi:pimeloyl-ACP methyl ester carboxylesterase
VKLTKTLLRMGMAAATAFIAIPAVAQTDLPDHGAKNIVIVPGAFVDGSGWRVVFDILSHKGYNVRIVQPPHTTLEDDVAATNEAITGLIGPVVLVGHSYGGGVISIAGDRQKVKALVYVAAFEPEVGETMAQLLGSRPAPSDDVRKTRDGHLYFDPAKFPTDFAGDLTINRSAFLAMSQVPVAEAAFNSMPLVAAWHKKPTYGIVTTDDRALSPDLQRWMYQRAGSKITEIKASHLVYVSQPDAVAKVIEDAARAVN